jgi:radical SAM protein with 4Fe4S-binding SPASM domain
MYLSIKQQAMLNEDSGVLHSSRGAHSLRLNDDAISIVKAIGTAGNSYDAVLASVAAGLTDDPESFHRIKLGFDAFLNFLEAEGFLVRSDNKVRSNFRIVGKPRISRLFVELLSGCNLTCSHCYAHHATASHHLRDVDRLLDHFSEAAEFGVHKIDLTGGEVFIFPRLRSILEHLTELNIPVNLYSNLTMLDAEGIDYLTKQSIASVITSIDALTPEKHDRFRGMPGAWQKTVGNIRQLIDAGMSVRVNIVPTNETLHEIKQLCNLLYNEIGVTNIVIGTLFDVGRQKQSRIDHIAQETISELIADINVDVFRRDLDVWKNNNVHKRVDIARPGCGVGHDMLFLSSWGEYAYCPILTSRESPQFAVGNFYHHSFTEIAEQFLKNKSAPSCTNVGSCSYGAVCQGGCRARAFHTVKDLNARDSTRCSFWSALDRKSVTNEVV